MPSIRPIKNIVTTLSSDLGRVAKNGASIPDTFNGSGAIRRQLPDLAEKIRQLTSRFSACRHKMQINGKDVEVIKFQGSQAGSNPGYWIRSQKGNALAYVKSPGYEQATSEVLAGKLYELAGIKTPKMAIADSVLPPVRKFDHPTSVREIVSNFVPVDRLATGADAPALREGFGADCWLANWDALKRGNCAMLGDDAIRMDVGGSLMFRAQGGRKGIAFGEDVKELTTFFDSRYSQSYHYLKDMTQKELTSSLSKVASLSDDAIKKLVYESGVASPEYLAETLIARKNYIKTFLNKAKYTQMKNGETMSEFVGRIQTTMPKTTYELPFERFVMSTRCRSDLPKGTSMAEVLTPSQKRVFDESYLAYKASRGQAIQHNASDILTEDAMLHVANTKCFDSILERGIVTSDFFQGVGKGTGMETLTPLCADFWEIKNAQTIKQYFTRKPLNCPNGELNFLPNTNLPGEGGRMVFVINKNAVNETVMKNSFNVYPRPKNGIMFKDGNMDPHSYPTHIAVPIGVPSNAIDRVIIDTSRFDSAKIAEIKTKLEKSGLDIKMYDLEGKCLYEGLKPFKASLGKEFESMLEACEFQRIPLNYPRKKFVYEIASLLDRMPEAKRAEFLSKFNLKLGVNDIDGIPNIKGFEPHTLEEVEMFNLIEKFYSNSVTTQNLRAKNVLDSILKEFPEFGMVVGKPQHRTHAYSVDIHSIKLLQTAIKNKNYAKLSDEGKEVLKLSALMHDFGKLGNVRTPGHAVASRKYAEEILENHKVSEAVKNRVLNMIEHHHWFEAYRTGQMSPQEFKQIFPTSEDRFIAMLFAKGDFESVSSTFHFSRLESGRTLTQAEYEEDFRRIMNELLKKI